MKRKKFDLVLLGITAALFACSAGAQQRSQPQPPNVVVKISYSPQITSKNASITKRTSTYVTVQYKNVPTGYYVNNVWKQTGTTTVTKTFKNISQTIQNPNLTSSGLAAITLRDNHDVGEVLNIVNQRYLTASQIQSCPSGHLAIMTGGTQAWCTKEPITAANNTLDITLETTPITQVVHMDNGLPGGIMEHQYSIMLSSKPSPNFVALPSS